VALPFGRWQKLKGLREKIWGEHPIANARMFRVESRLGHRNETRIISMNSKPRLHKAEFVPNGATKLKTLDLRLVVTDRDLRKEVKRAFDLAKSGGRELNATFSYGAS
jgi:hypothetical protein